MGSWVDYAPLILLALVFWLLILRPMRKRQQAFKDTQGAIGVGSKVMLGSGIYGEVVSIMDDKAQLKIAPNTTITVARAAIARVEVPTNPHDAESGAPEQSEGN